MSSIACKSSLVFLFIHILFLLPAPADGQDLPFLNISREQGLSNSTVFSIFQDSYGFMWFGTGDGLNRYDGSEMQIFRNDAKSPESISDNYIKCIFEDRQRNLWVGTLNGLNLLDRKSGKFKRFFLKKSRTDKGGTDVNCILEDARNNLWIGTQENGIALFDKSTSNLRPINPTIPNDKANTHINYLYQDRKQNIWIASNQGLLQANESMRHLKQVMLPGKDIRSIAEDAAGNIWIASEGNGVYRYAVKAKTLSNFKNQEGLNSSLGSNLIRTLLIDKQNNVWIGTINGGLNLFDAKKNNFQRYIYERAISALYQDSQGNIWIGTHRNGIYLYAPKAVKFNLVQKQQHPHILENNDVKTFFEDKQGNVWIGTDGGGIAEYNPKTRKVRKFKSSPSNPNSLGSNFILDITGDNNSNLWISSWGGGISYFDRQTERFTRIVNNPKDNTSLSSNYVQKILPDDKGNFWVGTYFGGLSYLNTSTRTFTRYHSDRSKKTAIWGNNIVAICEDSQKGNLWIGTDDAGLNYFDKEKHHFRHYFVNIERSLDIRIIFKDQKGRIWVGEKGLFLYNRSKDRFEPYIKSNILSSCFIKGILEDERGLFWISTLDGLVRLNPETGATKRYNTSDGLQSLEFEANAAMKTSSGEMFFGGINGYNHFYPDRILTNRFVPPIYFTNLTIFNKKASPNDDSGALTEDLPFAKEINLNHKQSSFSVSYAALNYTSSNNNQYAYKLEGFDADWTYVGNITKASYTNLDPGSYTLKLKAANNDGIWNTKAISLSINIIPSFWQRLWFKLLVGFLIIGAILYVLYLQRELELEKLEERKKDEIHQMQLDLFTNISHEFKTPLALIMGRIERIITEKPDKHLIPHLRSLSKNSTHLLNLITELMDFRKVESGSLRLNVSEGNLSTFLNELTEEFSILAQEKSIQLKIKNEIEAKSCWFDKLVMERIISNLIHNSLKYTSPGGEILVEIIEGKPAVPAFKNELQINSNYKAQRLIGIRILDSGIGISEESLKVIFNRYYRITDTHLGSGVGLAFVKSLTLLHKGEIYVSSEKHKGTEIVVIIPCAEVDYAENEKRTKQATAAGIQLESINVPLAILTDETPQDETGSENKPKSKKLILLVEDNLEMRTLLKEFLEPHFNISEAANGADAYQKVSEEYPDLIISDLMMEKMDGNELCKKIREDASSSHIPFIMLTAQNSISSQITGLKTGADFYLSKPVSFQLLLVTINNIFAQRQKLREHYIKGHQSEIKELVHNAREKEFMDSVLAIIEHNMGTPEFDADYLCREIAMSKTNLYHKLKSITGQSIGEFMRTVRLNKAKEIMASEDVLVNEVMFRVGIQTQSYFTRIFKAEFGITPSQFLQEIKSRI
jgi:ligand-binding sensor domain-containing protein/signal transduction histidine kinase/DNA-binding response OmpR family regulator